MKLSLFVTLALPDRSAPVKRWVVVACAVGLKAVCGVSSWALTGERCWWQWGPVGLRTALCCYMTGLFRFTPAIIASSATERCLQRSWRAPPLHHSAAVASLVECKVLNLLWCLTMQCQQPLSLATRASRGDENNVEEMPLCWFHCSD